MENTTDDMDPDLVDRRMEMVYDIAERFNAGTLTLNHDQTAALLTVTQDVKSFNAAFVELAASLAVAFEILPALKGAN